MGCEGPGIDTHRVNADSKITSGDIRRNGAGAESSRGWDCAGEKMGRKARTMICGSGAFLRESGEISEARLGKHKSAWAVIERSSLSRLSPCGNGFWGGILGWEAVRGVAMESGCKEHAPTEKAGVQMTRGQWRANRGRHRVRSGPSSARHGGRAREDFGMTATALRHETSGSKKRTDMIVCAT